MPDEPPKDFVVVLGSALSIDREGSKLTFISLGMTHEMTPERLEQLGQDCIRQAGAARYWRDKGAS
jgi:pyruvate/2-oxoglutarate/acetoin dehydrogenase E1 component